MGPTPLLSVYFFKVPLRRAHLTIWGVQGAPTGSCLCSSLSMGSFSCLRVLNLLLKPFLTIMIFNVLKCLMVLSVQFCTKGVSYRKTCQLWMLKNMSTFIYRKKMHKMNPAMHCSWQNPWYINCLHSFIRESFLFGQTISTYIPAQTNTNGQQKTTKPSIQIVSVNDHFLKIYKFTFSRCAVFYYIIIYKRAYNSIVHASLIYIIR